MTDTQTIWQYIVILCIAIKILSIIVIAYMRSQDSGYKQAHRKYYYVKTSVIPTVKGY